MIAHTLNMRALFILCTIDNIFWNVNLDVIKSIPPFVCLYCLFVCNLLFKQISFLYIQTLHNDCPHIEDVHRQRHRAEYGLVLSSV